MLAERIRTEDITYTDTPCAPSQPRAISRDTTYIHISTLCPFIPLAEGQGPALISSPSQISFSFSSTLNQDCPLLGHMGPLYSTCNVALNMLYFS